MLVLKFNLRTSNKVCLKTVLFSCPDDRLVPYPIAGNRMLFGGVRALNVIQAALAGFFLQIQSLVWPIAVDKFSLSAGKKLSDELPQDTTDPNNKR